MSSSTQDQLFQRVQRSFQGGGSGHELCLLALDGGGVKGLSALFILRRIMTRVNAEREKNGKSPVKPCEVFDMIGGTSTGGLIAILLGRLELNMDECITIYQEMVGTIFGHTQHLLPFTLSNGEIQNRFDPARLRAAIISVLESKRIPVDEKYDNGAVRACHTFVVARRVENKNPVAIRDYTPVGEENHDQATIVEAALATSAASTFFPPIQIGARQYVDGALGSNNPVAILWKEAQDLWAPDDGQIKPLLNCVLSIGTGRSSFKKVDTKVWGFLTKTLKDLVTETEETAQSFAFANRDLIQPNKRRQYFRFNVDQGLEEVGLEEHDKVNIIEAATVDYLTLNQDRKFEVQTCGEGLSTKELMNKKIMQAIPIGADILKRKTLLECNGMAPSGTGLQTQDIKILIHVSSECIYSLLGVRDSVRKNFNKTSRISVTSCFRKREGHIKAANPGTLTWLWKDGSDLDQWTKSDRGLFHIQGKPGSGKSVTMKHISTEYKKKFPHEIVVSYFFDRLGEELQKTLEGYLRHLLARVLRRYPALFRCIREFYHSEMFDYDPDPDTGISVDIDWTETSLRTAWNLILESRSYTPKITLFVDAIDECNESKEVAVIKLFHESCLARFPVSVKVCFSSRTKLSMSDLTLGKIPGLLLDSKTSTDISSYVRSNLNATAIKAPPGQDLSELEALFIDKADGCWLWAEFAVKALDKPHYTLADLIRELENIPSQLYGLFDSFWDNIDLRNIEETNNMLAVVLAAEVPLDLEDFCYIMALGVGKHHGSQLELQQQLDFIQDDSTMWSRIQERCSYFLELKVDETQDLDFIPKGNVQFYHSSLKEYLTQPDKSTKRAVLSYEELSKKGHQIIGRACLCYLQFTEVQKFRLELDSAQKSYSIQNRGAIIRRIPFIVYSGVFAFQHSCRIIQQDDLQAEEIERFWTPSQFDGWLTIFIWAAKLAVPDKSWTMLSLAIQEGAYVFVRRIIDHGVVDVNEMIPTWGHYLTLAAFIGEFKIVKLLLDLEDPIVDIDAQGGNFCNALQAAAYQGHKDIVQLLLDNGADPHITGGKFETPLCAAAYSWDFELVELLMTHPKCASTSFHDQWHNSQALFYVGAGSLSGDDEDRNQRSRPKNSSTVVKLIARRGFDNAFFVSMEVPLVMWLLGRGSMDVMKMLVQDSRYIHARSSDGFTLLHVALAYGTLDMAKMLCEKLLETSSSLDIDDREDCTPVHYAAINQDVGVLKYVLEQARNDVDVNGRSDSGITSLHAAFAISSKAHIKLLRSVGANHEILGPEGLTILHFGMSNYAHTDQLEVLSELVSLDIEARDIWERTPLHIAAQYGSLENVKWLLDHKAKIEAINDEGMTVLHAACQNFTSYSTAIIDLLVEKGLSFSARDYGGSTPLHLAFHDPKHVARNLFWVNFVPSPFDKFSESSCNRTVNHILVNKLADLSAKDNSGHTPLHLACWRGLCDSIITMVELGASLDTENSLGSPPLDLVEDPDIKYALETLLPFQRLSAILEVDSDIDST